jgi:hypothetical protein
METSEGKIKIISRPSERRGFCGQNFYKSSAAFTNNPNDSKNTIEKYVLRAKSL